ncbi:MAG: hypothetical protein CfClM3_0498 [Methanobrevibacter sp. CfCl-M3]
MIHSKKYHFIILIAISAIYLFNRFIFTIDSCHLNDFLSGIWLISVLKLYMKNININFLAIAVIVLAIASEYLAPLIKHTAVFDYMDIVVIIIGGLGYLIILNCYQKNLEKRGVLNGY